MQVDKPMSRRLFVTRNEIDMHKTEYERLMEQTPQIIASGLEGDYCALAEFNNVVLAGHQTK